ncbi:MAG: glycosyltransferase family 4 protein [Verrucomicrobiaceae bacterium]
MPFTNFEENTRWTFLPLYDWWVRRQKLPDECNVVMGPMGSCTPLYDLADQCERRILKVFDAPNSHPYSMRARWQGECDEFADGAKIPFPDSTIERIADEIKRADLILCPSIFVRDSMIENGVPPEKCFVTHFGVNTSIFRPRKSLPEVPTFVSVGNVCLRKGHQYLFRAFEKVRKEYPNARLICIGAARPDFDMEWPRWENMVEYHPSLPHSEVAEKLQGSTAFVLASVEEGFARVLSEAMACALPIIATAETGATTVMKDNEEALIVPCRDVEAIEKAMVKLIEDTELNMAMGERAYAVGAVENTWDDYSGRLYDIFAEKLEKLNAE